jgi:hypothetical protein
MSINHLISQNPATPELDISVKNLTVQGSVNNLTPSGGLFMITSNGPLISNTTDEINLIQGASLVGSNQVSLLILLKSHHITLITVVVLTRLGVVELSP